jgi:general transcription factor 3C polypeptide 3 (transcription factor C subunit 4)
MDGMDMDQPAAATAYTADNFQMAMVDPSLYQQDGLEQDLAAEDDDEDDVASDISADSDALELRAEVERFDLQQEAFVARQRAEASGIPYQPPPPRKPGRGPGRKPKRVLGPRKPAKPPPEIQFRLSLANEAFQQKDYDRTMAQLSEIIRINSEVFHAWTLLSTVHETLGNREQAIWCRITAAHLTPRDVQQWISTAEYALESMENLEDGPEKDAVLTRAYACYTQALETDRSNIIARTGRADVIMLQGNANKALIEYQKALNYRPWNIRTVRNIADVALDVKDPRKSAEVAKGAYRRLIDHLQATGTFDAEEGSFEWSDLRIYLEFFTILEQWQEGAQELKEISRWLLGRRAESHWDQWVDDDREWDIYDDRRLVVPGFEPARFPQESYGQGLPIDLRAKLFVYRSKLGFEYEANLHLQMLDPTRPESFMDFPDCLKEIAVSLLDRDRADDAIRYLDLYRHIATTTGDVALDADFLVCQGRCHIAFGEKAAAEECFIAAIQEDEDQIEARVQLANMYEGVEEQEGREEAFLLIREALNLEARRGDGVRRRRGPYGPRKPRDGQPRKPRDPNRKSKYVPRRLINAEKRRQQDLEMTAEAAKNFQLLKEFEERALKGDEQAKAGWMKAAKDLVDDFRSYKQFYPWEKYIRYLGYTSNVQGGQAAVPARNLKLAAMEERLRQRM